MRMIRENNATAALEFAILSPLFILLLVGMMAYGIYFGASHSIQQIAADAARTAVAGLDQPERQVLASDFVEEHAGGYVFVDPARLRLDVADTTADGTEFAVAPRYDARNLPIWNLFGPLPLPAMTIERRSVIRVGGL